MKKKRGRPRKKKPIDSFVSMDDIVVEPTPVVSDEGLILEEEPDIPEPSGLLCQCGQPVASGQTSVCLDCQKSG